MTKRPSAQVEADVYLRWKLVHLFLPVQKLPSCCEAVWLSLCLRLSSAVRLDCILYLKCSYVWETKCLTVRHAAVFCCCFFHSVSLPYVIQSSSQVCLIDPTTESLHTHPRHRASSSSHSCLTFVETDWGFEGWHGGSVATVDWSLASLSRRCLFRAFVLGQKIRFLFFFLFFVLFFVFLVQNSAVVSIICPQFLQTTGPSMTYHVHIICLSASCHNSMWRGSWWWYYKPTERDTW